jgi:hypothetical protein
MFSAGVIDLIFFGKKCVVRRESFTFHISLHVSLTASCSTSLVWSYRESTGLASSWFRNELRTLGIIFLTLISLLTLFRIVLIH